MNNILNIANLDRSATINALDEALYKNTKGMHDCFPFEIVDYDAADSGDGNLKVTLNVQVNEGAETLRGVLENQLNDSELQHFSISDAERWKIDYREDMIDFLTREQAYHFLKEQRDDIISYLFQAVALALFGDEVDSYEVVEELVNRYEHKIEFHFAVEVQIELSDEDIVQVAKGVISAEAA